MRSTLLIVLSVLCSVGKMNAQVRTGSVSGVITTADGLPAPDVTVVLKNTARGAVTAADGSFEIKRLHAGTHVLEISLVGFATRTQQVTINPGEQQVTRLTLDLSASALKEVIIRSRISSYKATYPSSGLRILTPLLHTPQNIQVVTENTLSDQQIFDMSEAVVRNVSGATAAINESWGNYANLIMRGGSMTAFRNGMNVKMPWGPLLEDMSMVDRIEFVKGPAGFMLSSGEPSGMYNIVTKKPTGVTRGHVGFSMGSFDTYRTTIDLDGKASPDGKLLYRVNLMGQLKNSHREYDYNKRYALAPVLKYALSPKTSLTAEYHYQYMKMAMLGSAYLFSNEMGNMPREFTMLEPNMEPSDIRDHYLLLSFQHQYSANWKLTTQVSYLNYSQTGSTIWPAYPSGLKPNGDLTRSISNWDAFSEARIGQVFLNGQVSTGPVTHRILTGMDRVYKDYYADFYQSDTISGYDRYGTPVVFNIHKPVHGFIPSDHMPKFDRTLPLRQRAGGTMGESSGSIYLQDEMGMLRDRIRVTFAGRYTNLKQHSFGTYSKDAAFMPRAGISISLNRSASVYGLYDKTFIAQQGSDSSLKPFVPVTGNIAEAGVKKDWAGGQWNSTLAVYRIQKNNVITLVPGPEYKMVQTGQTRTRGVELDVRGDLTRSFSVVMNYAFTESKVTKDEDPDNVGGPIPGPGFPGHIQNSWLRYRVPAGKLKGLSAAAGYQFLSGRQHELPDYFRVDGHLSWETQQVKITLNANNVLDRYLYAGAPYEYNNNPATSEYYFQVEPGINFRLGIGIRLGNSE